MQRESKKFLFDIEHAGGLISKFIAGKTLEDYESDELLRSAVERQFEIIGEAISQLQKIDLPTVEKIPDFKRIVAFRNILIHGYATIENKTVWGVVEGELSNLLKSISSLLSESL